MKKNDTFITDITDITEQGLGVGKAEGVTAFVKDAAVGDRVKIKVTCVKKNYCFAIIEEFIKQSDDRIVPDCPVFSKCGGCTLRHISYEAELKFKQNRVFETMRRIGKVEIPPCPIISGEPYFYRNKAQYPVSEEGTGFYAAHSHRVIPCEDCLLSPKEFSLAAGTFMNFIRQNGISVYNEESGKGLVRHFYIRRGFNSGEIQAVAVINGDKMPFEDKLCDALRQALGERLKSVVINVNKAKTNVILGDKCRTVFGGDFINDTICGVKVRLSPLSFYQVNTDMAQNLYQKAREYATPDGKRILDLYCGAGTIGLSMADAAKEIIGVEVVEAAVKDARYNADACGIKNAEFICSRAADAVKRLKENNLMPDVVIMDPPRKGCDENLLKTVANDFCPERIVYISCDVSTLARDVALLGGMGYTVTEYTPVDLFPRTTHVETVCLIEKRKGDQNE